jgi:hypothetical protein
MPGEIEETSEEDIHHRDTESTKILSKIEEWLECPGVASRLPKRVIFAG